MVELDGRWQLSRPLSHPIRPAAHRRAADAEQLRLIVESILTGCRAEHTFRS
jgi:hypothetical protein